MMRRPRCTILRYHHRSVSVDDVRQAIYADGAIVPTALARQIIRLPTPSIAHMLATPGRFPRPSAEWSDGFFEVLETVSARRVRLISPYRGRRDVDYDELVKTSSGVFLVFEEATALPRAQRVDRN